MKNKKVTYLLIVMVAVVWGVIIYRIFDASTGSDDTITMTNPVKTIKEPYDDYMLPKDTTKLLLNYRDPFGIVAFKDTTTIKAIATHHPTKSVTIIPKVAFNWGFIQYAGYIRNPSSKKLIALVTINGKNEMLAEGETKDQVKLIKNQIDSIKVSFNGKTKYITLKTL